MDTTITIIILAVHAACSAITAATPTPSTSSRWYWLYRVVELLALVTGKAKDR